MINFGNWRLTTEWIESENARIPLDSISYVGSLDLMNRLRKILLAGAIFFGVIAIFLLLTANFGAAFLSAVVSAILYYLHKQNSTTFVVISHSGYMIQQTTGRIVKGDAEYERFMDALFKYRRKFIGTSHESLSTPPVDVYRSRGAEHTIKQNEKEISSNGNLEEAISKNEIIPTNSIAQVSSNESLEILKRISKYGCTTTTLGEPPNVRWEVNMKNGQTRRFSNLEELEKFSQSLK